MTTTPVQDISYLFDAFIEGGYAEPEDIPHLDAIHGWLTAAERDNERRLIEKLMTSLASIRNTFIHTRYETIEMDERLLHLGHSEAVINEARKFLYGAGED